MMPHASRLVLLASVMLSSACVYDVPRKWVATDQFMSDKSQKPEPFRLALTACVTQYDPAHLYQLDNGGEYQQISGWFLSHEKSAVMNECMQRKGWMALPTVLLSP